MVDQSTNALVTHVEEVKKDQWMRNIMFDVKEKGEKEK